MKYILHILKDHNNRDLLLHTDTPICYGDTIIVDTVAYMVFNVKHILCVSHLPCDSLYNLDTTVLELIAKEQL